MAETVEEENDDSLSVLRICNDCDDVVSLEWYRLCAACGHDFGSGIEPGVTRATELAPRAVTYLIAALVATAAALIGYFVVLLGGGK